MYYFKMTISGNVLLIPATFYVDQVFFLSYL